MKLPHSDAPFALRRICELMDIPPHLLGFEPERWPSMTARHYRAARRAWRRRHATRRTA